MTLQLLGLTVDFEVEQIHSIGVVMDRVEFQKTGRLRASRHTRPATNASVSPNRTGNVLRAKAAVDAITIPSRDLTSLDQCHISLTPWAWPANSN